MLEAYQIAKMYDLEKTIAHAIFQNKIYPWDVLGNIHNFILQLGADLPEEKFEQIRKNVWVAKSANIHPSVTLIGPCIIDEKAELRPNAFVRENVIIGKGATVGNSTELKNAILFDEAQAPHFNYIGDSILGYRAHLGAGAVTSNLKSDKSLVTIKMPNDIFETGLRKMGAMLGDFVEVGCNAVLNPGCVVGRNTSIYPTSCVRGLIPKNSIYKLSNDIVKKQ